MKHALKAVIALALGAGLATAAQAHGINQRQSAAPGSQIQSAAPAKNMQAAAPQRKQRHAKAQKAMKPGQNIRQAQLRLKSEGLLKGKVTGKMDRQTRLALAKEKRTQLARSGSSMQKTRIAHATARMPKSQTTGVGSSMPNTKNTAGAPMTPATTPAP